MQVSRLFVLQDMEWCSYHDLCFEEDSYRVMGYTVSLAFKLLYLSLVRIRLQVNIRNSANS